MIYFILNLNFLTILKNYNFYLFNLRRVEIFPEPSLSAKLVKTLFYLE